MFIRVIVSHTFIFTGAVSLFSSKTILEEAAKVLKCNTNDFLESSRISDSNKLNRDLLIYLLWSTGWYNNQEIGNLFGLG
ncbi:MAG: hypothetical protein AABY49_01505, partial [Planctomycetota bacterium]